jgi:hypothetical protein
VTPWRSPRSARHSPWSGKSRFSLVDLGWFVELLNRGRLRLIDQGVRDLGIVAVGQGRSGSRKEAGGKRAGYALVPAASRWR